MQATQSQTAPVKNQEAQTQASPNWQSLALSIGIPLAIALFAIMLYANTFDAGLLYSWDDNRYLPENHLIQAPINLNSLWDIIVEPYFAAHIPVTLASYWLEYNAWGLEPYGYHIVNVIIHAINSVLVYFVVHNLLKKRWVAVFTTLFFVAHPLQVETVAWISQRKNLLAMTFTLLSMLAYMRSADDDAPIWATPTAWVMYLLAALAKPAVVGMPLVFLVYDYFWAKKSLIQSLIRSIVPAAIAVASAILIYEAHDNYGGIKEQRGGSIITNLRVMLIVMWDYVEAIFFPFHLNNRYYYGVGQLTMPIGIVKQILGFGMVVSSLVIIWSWLTPVGNEIRRLLGDKTAPERDPNQTNLTAIEPEDSNNQPEQQSTLGKVLGFILPWKRPIGTPFVLFTVVWIWAFMLPVANIVPIAIERTDRYMYFPLIVVFALIGLTLAWLWDQRSEQYVRYGILAVVTFVMVVLTATTFQRNEVWHSSATLWSDHLDYQAYGVDYAEFSTTGWLNLGVFYYHERDYENATPTFESLLEIEPSSFKGNRFMGHIALNQSRPTDAINWYRRALQIEPNDPPANYQIAQAYFQTREYSTAVQHYRRAFENDNSLPTGGLINWGLASMQLREYDTARQIFAAALERENEKAAAASGLCTALAELDRFEEGIPYCVQSIELEPNNPLYIGRLGHVLIMGEQFEDALRVGRRAAEVKPDMSLAYRIQGDAYRGLGQGQNAVAAYEQALVHDENNRRAREGLQELTN